MRGKSWITAGAIVIALGACGLGAYHIANGLARDSIESTASATLEKELKDRLGSDAAVDVQLGDGTNLQDIGSGKLKDVNASVTVGYDAIVQQLHNRGATMIESVTGSGDTLTLNGQAKVAGISVPVSANVKLIPDGQGVKAQLTGLEAAGEKVDPKVLPKSVREQFTEGPIPLPAMPAGIDITSIAGGADGMKVALHADSLTMDDLRKGL